MALAYGGGISLAHWTTAINTVGEIGSGSLTVEVADDGSEIDFECVTNTFPHHALSFVRFWATDQNPGDLVPRGTGAMKIEEDGNESEDGYSIEPADAAIGDTAVVHLGTSTVTITAWIPKPVEPDEYIGFAYSVEGDPVTVDVVAATDLWRQVITGSGVWSLDGIAYDGPTIVIESCEPATSEIVLTITNVGSIPALPYLTLQGDPGSTDCAAFQAAIVDTDGAALDSGVLCDLYGRPLLVSEQIDPGDATTVTITFEPVLPVSPGVKSESFAADVVFTQWNSPLESGYGWIDTVNVALTATLTVTEPPPAPDPAPGPTSEPIPEPPTVDTDTTLPEPEPEPEPAPAPAPAPAIVDPATASLTGLVWLDDEEDTATVPGGSESGLDGIWVVLLDESGAEQSLAMTDADGYYTFEGLDPGRYVVGVRSPNGYSFPGVTTDAPDDILLDDGLAETLATQWGVEPLDVVVSDIIRATTTPLGIVGWTGAVELTDGPNTGTADAALTLVPTETPPESEAAEAAETDEAAEGPVDNTEISAKEPEPDPFEETLPETGADAGETAGAEGIEP